MKKQEYKTEKTVHALLSGTHPLAKKFGGEHVFVIDDKIAPLGRKKKSILLFKQLKEKYGKSPILVFVPQPGSSYILLIIQ